MIPASVLSDLLGRLGKLTERDPGEALGIVYGYVETFTRGRGFSNGVPTDDVAAVIVSAAARLAASPTLKPLVEVGPTTLRHRPFDSFTMAERQVLHRYRQRTG